MIRALEAYDRRAAGKLACQLDCLFDAFAAAAGEQCLFLEVTGSDFIQQFSQRHVWLVGGHEGAGVDETRRLRMNGLHDRTWRVADGHHADAACKIDQGVAVDIMHQSALGSFDDDFGRASETGWHTLRPACKCGFWRVGPGISVSNRM